MKLSRLQEYELFAAIVARGEIPVKYAYMGDGAKLWDELYKSRMKNQNVTSDELTLLETHGESFLKVFQDVKGVNLIDLGCGNGQPADRLINILKSLGLKVTYTAIDISQDMLDLGTNYIRSLFSDVEVNAILLDFEKETLTDKLFKIKSANGFSNLLVNLGNTLGNYSNASAVLTNFAEAMGQDDYLLLGNGLVNDQNPQKILHTYLTDTFKSIALHIPEELNIYEKIVDNFSVVWNPAKSRIEARIELKKDKNLKLADQKAILESGMQVMTIKSNKYSEASLMQELTNVNLRSELITTTHNRGYILAMVQPTSYSQTLAN